jgi:hypothetical protein
MADYLDNYAHEYAKLADKAWKDYGKKDIWTRDVWTVEDEGLVEMDREVADD